MRSETYSPATTSASRLPRVRIHRIKRRPGDSRFCLQVSFISAFLQVLFYKVPFFNIGYVVYGNECVRIGFTHYFLEFLLLETVDHPCNLGKCDISVAAMDFIIRTCKAQLLLALLYEW